MKDVYIAAAAQIVSHTQRPLIKGTVDIIDMQAMAAHVVTLARAIEDKVNALDVHEDKNGRLASAQVWEFLAS